MKKNLPLCLLLALLAIYCLSLNTHNTPAMTIHSTPHMASIPLSSVAGQHAIQGPPTVTAAFIDSTLCKAASPACGTGQVLYDYGKLYDIDPAYALAFFKHESSYGKYGVASTNRGIGNIRCTPGYQCLYGFRAYASWQQGYADWYQLIRWYITDLHKSTIEQIVPTYAPSVENDTPAYIASVVDSVAAWRAGNL